MSKYEMPAHLREALDYLAIDNLWVYDLERISLYVVGLKTILRSKVPAGTFNSERPAPVEVLEVLIKTCSAIRARLSELQVDQKHRVYKELEEVVRYISSHFSSSYHISQDVIEEERFYDKVYRLLRELNLRDSSSRLNDSWSSRSVDEIKLAKDKYRRELLEFVKENPAKVVETVYHWANKGVGRDAKISSQREGVFNLFFLIESEINHLKMERLD